MQTNKRLEIAQSWINWISETGSVAQYNLKYSSSKDEESKSIIGYLIQASAEHPEDFHRIFSNVFNDEKINPLTVDGANYLVNLYRNGICDDWEVFIQWRESGYIVVNEGLRQSQDARFNVKQAIRLLDIITGGPALAPGIANESELIQDMYEKDAAILASQRRSSEQVLK